MGDARPDAGPYQPRRYAGLRRMTPPLYRSAEEAEAFEGLPQGMTPWDVFWHLDRAAVPMGFSRVEIDTLRVLFKFSQAQDWAAGSRPIVWPANDTLMRSEEHTSELQSLMRISYDVFGLKKKQ